MSIKTQPIAGDRVTVVTKPPSRAIARYEGATVRPSRPGTLNIEWFSGGELHKETIDERDIVSVVIK